MKPTSTPNRWYEGALILFFIYWLFMITAFFIATVQTRQRFEKQKEHYAIHKCWPKIQPSFFEKSANKAMGYTDHFESTFYCKDGSNDK